MQPKVSLRVLREPPSMPVRQACAGCRYLMPESSTCAIAVANKGRHTSSEIAPLMGVTRTYIQALEAKALAKLRKRGRFYGLDVDALLDLPRPSRHQLDFGDRPRDRKKVAR